MSKDKIKHKLTKGSFKDMIRASERINREAFKRANKRKLYSHGA